MRIEPHGYFFFSCLWYVNGAFTETNEPIASNDLQSITVNDLLTLDLPPREMLLTPFLPTPRTCLNCCQKRRW